MINLFQLGDFKLHSGQKSSFKIECDALTDSDLECIAFLLSLKLPSFGSVEGVPSGGLRLAEKMKKYATTGPLLLVDDVMTTGRSMENRKTGDAIGAVIFSRGVRLPWVTALLVMEN